MVFISSLSFSVFYLSLFSVSCSGFGLWTDPVLDAVGISLLDEF